eukprot:INCI1155.1.p2 GENE.INCI1155.1~~INCI1155.1.p2  ORF type:complete len:211 (-),score=65.41 INCI1155.1:1532-2164(-)
MSRQPINITEADMAKAMAAIQQGEGKNERGIPAVTFIPDVEAFLKKNDMRIEILFENLSILQRKYRFMMQHLQSNKVTVMVKIPEIERTLKAVQHLMRKAAADEEVQTSFPLNDGVYVDATVAANQGTVYLWLGANVMLEYSYEEAEKLLKEQAEAANRKVEEQASDIMFLRDQITTTEVNIARAYNYDVLLRKKQREEEAENSQIQKAD